MGHGRGGQVGQQARPAQPEQQRRVEVGVRAALGAQVQAARRRTVAARVAERAEQVADAARTARPRRSPRPAGRSSAGRRRAAPRPPASRPASPAHTTTPASTARTSLPTAARRSMPRCPDSQRCAGWREPVSQPDREHRCRPLRRWPGVAARPGAARPGGAAAPSTVTARVSERDEQGAGPVAAVRGTRPRCPARGPPASARTTAAVDGAARPVACGHGRR